MNVSVLRQRGPSPTSEVATLGDYAQVLRRRPHLVIGGLVLGLLLGMYALPGMFARTTSYSATTRIDVRPMNPALVPTSAVTAKSTQSTGGVKDVTVMEAVLTRFGKALGIAPGQSKLAIQARAASMAKQLSATTVSGTTYVDVSFVSPDRQFAARVITAYADEFVRSRNAIAQSRLSAVVASLSREAATLQAQVVQLSNEIDAQRVQKIPTSTATQTELRLTSTRYAGKVHEIDSLLEDQVLRGTLTSRAGPVLTGIASQPPARSLFVAVGLLLGLLAGLGAAFLREGLRSSFRQSDEVEEACQAEVLTSVPSQGRPRRRNKVVAAPYTPMAEGYQRLRAELQLRGLGDSLGSLSVLSPDRGAGKTTLVANLGHALAAQGHSVVLISTDLRHPTLDAVYGLGRYPGISELLLDPEVDPFEHLVYVGDGVSVLPAGNVDMNPSALLTGQRLEQIVTSLSSLGTLLLDTPPATIGGDAVTISRASDASVVVVRKGHTRATGAADLVQSLHRAKLPLLGLVLVGVATPVRNRYSGYYAPPSRGRDNAAAPRLRPVGAEPGFEPAARSDGKQVMR